MKKSRLAVFLIAGLFWVTTALHAQQFNRTSFYEAFSSSNVALIDKEIAIVQKSGLADKEAYEGALIMKKAAFQKGNGKKAEMFKTGHKLFEAAIARNNSSAELHLIRLMIQENAPKILKYHKNIEADTEVVKANFKKMPADLQSVVTGYSKTSKALEAADF